MAKSEATIVDAGGRDLRVSSAGRIIFPETDHTAAVTKLDVVNYYLAVEDGIVRALDRRPTTLERWPKGVHPGIVLSTREKGGGDAFFQKRIPRGAPDYVETARIEFPSGRHADEICATCFRRASSRSSNRAARPSGITRRWAGRWRTSRRRSANCAAAA